MKEVDIINFLRQVKKGNAPKEIEINGVKFSYFEDTDKDIAMLYINEDTDETWAFDGFLTLDTKVKIPNNSEIKGRKSNLDIRRLMKEKSIRQWMVADKLGVSEFTITRWLRKELNENKKQQIIFTINELEKELE